MEEEAVGVGEGRPGWLPVEGGTERNETGRVRPGHGTWGALEASLKPVLTVVPSPDWVCVGGGEGSPQWCRTPMGVRLGLHSVCV